MLYHKFITGLHGVEGFLQTADYGNGLLVVSVGKCKTTAIGYC